MSDSEDGSHFTLEGYSVKRLPWERTALRKVKEQLDKKHLESRPARSRQGILPRRRNALVSKRKIPDNPVDWAVREPLEAPLHQSTPNNTRNN